MTKITIALALATILGARNLRGDTPELPTYSYAIQSKSFKDAGVFLSSIHMRIPNTMWLCDLSYATRNGLLLRCIMPRTEGGDLPEVLTRVSCSSSDTDAETVHLGTLDVGVFATISIMCKRNLFDDGF